MKIKWHKNLAMLFFIPRNSHTLLRLLPCRHAVCRHEKISKEAKMQVRVKIFTTVKKKFLILMSFLDSQNEIRLLISRLMNF